MKKRTKIIGIDPEEHQYHAMRRKGDHVVCICDDKTIRYFPYSPEQIKELITKD